MDNGHPIREVLNSRERTFTDFLKVIEKADNYKHWLKGLSEDTNLIKEYYRAVTTETWVDKIPGKAFRWSFFTGAGLVLDAVATGGVGTIVGLGLSLGDAFIIDKMIKGWKPNMFIESNLKDFAKRK